MASSTSRNKLSQTLRALQAFVDENPKYESELEDLKEAITFVETRNAQMLEDKEDMISGLHARASKLERAEKSRDAELDEANKQIGELEIEREQFDEIIEGQNKDKASLEQERVDFKAKLEIVKEEKASLERRETSLVNVIVSLREDNRKLVKQSGLRGTSADQPVIIDSKRQKKRKSDAIDESEEGGEIKQEYEPVIRKKVRHWAPVGYYYIQEHFRRNPVRKKKSESEEDSEPVAHSTAKSFVIHRLDEDFNSD